MTAEKCDRMFGFEKVFQNHDLSLLFLRPPRYRVTCALIPLAVLKHAVLRELLDVRLRVTCGLIPLAVLKLQQTGVAVAGPARHMCPHTACGLAYKKRAVRLSFCMPASTQPSLPMVALFLTRRIVSSPL